MAGAPIGQVVSHLTGLMTAPVFAAISRGYAHVPSRRPLSSRELLSRIGLSEDAPSELFDEGALDDFEGDLGAVLRERFEQLTAKHQFAPGDLVTWKPGLKNRRVPRYGEPAVVVSVLDAPVFDDEPESGSTYFRDPLNLVLGMIWDRDPGRGDFVTFHFDGRRFEPLVD